MEPLLCLTGQPHQLVRTEQRKAYRIYSNRLLPGVAKHLFRSQQGLPDVLHHTAQLCLPPMSWYCCCCTCRSPATAALLGLGRQQQLLEEGLPLLLCARVGVSQQGLCGGWQVRFSLAAGAAACEVVLVLEQGAALLPWSCQVGTKVASTQLLSCCHLPAHANCHAASWPHIVDDVGDATVVHPGMLHPEACVAATLMRGPHPAPLATASTASLLCYLSALLASWTTLL
mmetsp:Transcript_36027/g.80186  ORF Transcript_36027/g.80186 Transcript_36027/m.80186 type:complete len:229 (+) Transcript_36027:501-1187(+)